MCAVTPNGENSHRLGGDGHAARAPPYLRTPSHVISLGMVTHSAHSTAHLRERSLLFWLAISCLGCKPSPEAEAATDSTTTSSMGTEAATDSTTTSSTDSETGMGTTADCSANHVPNSTPLDVTIRNNGKQPIYLVTASPDLELGPGFFVKRSYDLIDTTSNGVVNDRGICFIYRRCTVSYWCPYTFDTQNHDPCDATQAVPPPIMIAPGGAFRPPGWDGLTYTEATLPYDCQNALCGVPVDTETMCLRALSYEGTLAVRVRTGLGVECDIPEECSCEVNGDGWCTLGSGTVQSPVITESEIFQFPDTPTVEVAIP